jgi:hypothetical protein
MPACSSPIAKEEDANGLFSSHIIDDTATEYIQVRF